MAAARTGSTRAHRERSDFIQFSTARGSPDSATSAIWSGLGAEISDIRHTVTQDADRGIDRDQGGTEFLFALQELGVADGGVGRLVIRAVSLGCAGPGPGEADTADSGGHQHDLPELVHAQLHGLTRGPLRSVATPPGTTKEM